MINIEDCALLVVDVQGKLANMVHNSQDMIANILKLIQSCQTLSVPITVLEQNPNGLGPTTDPIKRCLNNITPFEKHSFNALAEQHIRDHIKSQNKKVWLVVGIEAHICVYQTALALLEEGLEVQLVSDGVSSRTSANRELAIENIRQAGAQITSVEMLVYQLMASSQHPKFKEVLQLVK